MDHTEAVRLQAAEKYLLNEFTPPQREEYEEHYFDCYECAEDLKATASFMESVRQLVREGVLEPQVARVQLPARAAQATPALTNRGWFAWLRPEFAVPVFAALLVFIGYQNGVTIPQLKNAGAQARIPEIAKYVSLPPVGSRSEAGPSLAIKVKPHQAILLEGDMPGNSATGYLCEIRDQSGRTLFSLQVSPEEAKDTVPISIPGGLLSPGTYKLVILKGRDSSAAAEATSNPSTMRFTVEFMP